MLPKLEKSLVDLFAARINTILQVEEPFEFDLEGVRYQAEYRSSDKRVMRLSIYREDSKTPQIHVEVKVKGVI